MARFSAMSPDRADQARPKVRADRLIARAPCLCANVAVRVRPSEWNYRGMKGKKKGPGELSTKAPPTRTMRNEALNDGRRLTLVHAKAAETQTFIKRLAGSTYFDWICIYWRKGTTIQRQWMVVVDWRGCGGWWNGKKSTFFFIGRPASEFGNE